MQWPAVAAASLITNDKAPRPSIHFAFIAWRRQIVERHEFELIPMKDAFSFPFWFE
jgi:hypothetical protein